MLEDNKDLRTDNENAAQPEKKRVCLYSSADQSSYYNTEEFMEQQLLIIALISNTPNWEYERIYLDNVGEHKALEEMLAACRAGCYDIIVTKSILHFAGNIRETIKIAKELASLDHPVEIIFTEEAVFTLDSDKMEDLNQKLLEEGE